jgi:hypothetical protein
MERRGAKNKIVRAAVLVFVDIAVQIADIDKER